jgi:molybdopterin/thiamine biosynthesis adenylyltransferase/proteasome lid subunit RPN8/RPN11
MTRVTLSLHGEVASQLREHAAGRLEIAGVLIVGISETVDEVRLLGRWFEPAAPETYIEQTSRRLRLDSDAYMPGLARADATGSVALFIHSHPDNEPVMSHFDDEVDEQLRSVFQIRTKSALYGSIVLHVVDDELSFSGRLWRGDDLIGPIELVREVGDRFRFTSAVDAPAPVPTAAAFDRQVRAFGGPIQELLHSLHVGIVGAGGTGSAEAELLIRAGVGELTVVDYEDLEDTNVTRLFGSRMEDVGRPKVDLIADNAERIGLGTKVNPIKAKVTRTVLDSLRACDIIFVCTDDNAGRLDVARLAYWCLIPVFDLGVVLKSIDGELSGIFCRVDVQLPGTACVSCSDVIDQGLARAEQLAQDELVELRRQGYAPEMRGPDPAVIAFTMRVAAEAFSELIVRITGIGDQAPSRTMTFVHDRSIHLTSDPPIPGHWCDDRNVWGKGVTRLRPLGRVWPTS